MDQTFENTRTALVEYDRTAPERKAKWDSVQTNADVDAAEQAETEALIKVQEAFFEDTKAYNRREDLVAHESSAGYKHHGLHIQTLRHMVDTTQ